MALEGFSEVNRPGVLERLIRRDQVLVVGGLIAGTALAWLVLLRQAAAMHVTVAEGAAMAGVGMPFPAASANILLEFLTLWTMWIVMMTAMMLASTAPVVLLVLTTYRRRAVHDAAIRSAAFVGGYLAIWAVFSAAAALAQVALQHAALLSPTMASTSRLVAGSVLVGAGVYQWLPIKNACLAHCWSPIEFLTRHWRDGVGGALAMGARHGAYCVGCCWALMLLLFAGGVMNLLCVAAIALFVLVEKLVRWEDWPSRVGGVILVGWGALVLAQL